MKPLLQRYGDVVLASLLALFFFAWPEADLVLARLFYHPGEGFPAAHIGWIKVIYEIVAQFGILVLLWMLLLLASFLPRLRARLAPRRKAILYLLVVLLTGPGLVVNTALKNHGGRPRPVHLAEFGGTAAFASPVTAHKQCPTNCSFPSGHAAAAFYLMAGYWVTRRRGWLAAGIGFGLFVGVIRMAMGAHFLSDILFAGLIVHFTCRGFAWLFALEPRRLPQPGRWMPPRPDRVSTSK
ncbi:phosphatase PAP2 family protein [Noviherbaspirillum denitrificans]|uniref:Phosphatidic acid phosphatase type 2/haloperoxidase domain-containing protein n=1 Tax=Noviherbaspirillum denitrificans TaxID=1968433 RepID=A0A254TKY5_9BURK|nr:phosphatase PAP2 family protein [Noviherbaspirillum denitrificans]OWW21982.1 hypothetical protein AYR66_23330 [Noviherbaspirillum denitrificans]